MYTTTEGYETYTSGTAPVDYERQELYATTLFKNVYQNFPSETQYADLDDGYKDYITKAIYEQITESINYTGTLGSGSSEGESFTVGSFSKATSTDTTTDNDTKMSYAANMFLTACGVNNRGLGSCQ